jgi:uncharacterized protein involved in exopolysaccharide biosynthesis
MEEEDIKGLGDYLAILSRRKKQFIIPALVIMVLSVILAISLPSVYRSEATILIEQQEIPVDLVRSTVTSYAGERIQMINQRVMTTANLSKIIDQYKLYEDERKNSSMATIAEEMRGDIGLEMVSADVVDPRSGRPTSATIAFKLSFSHKSPSKAQKVASELVSLYLDENLKRRTESAVETSGFLATESEKLQQKLSEYEAKLATFKEENINNLPELQQLNMKLMERSEGDLDNVELQIRNLEERIVYLSSELAQLSPSSTLYGADGQRILGSEDRLKALRAEFVTLSTRYADTHPDIIKMRREIKALEEEVGSGGDATELRLKLKEMKAELVSMKESYSVHHPDVKKLQSAVDATQKELDLALKEGKQEELAATETKPDNPAYIQIQTQLEAAEGELKSLKQSREELKTKLEDFEGRLLKSPQVEREYRELVREYENVSAKYQEIKAKQLQADMAEALEREKKGERFSLIEPPAVPEKPAKPNRMAILFLGFIFSLAGGSGTVAVAEGLSDAVGSTQELMNITGAPPLAVVPYIQTDAERQRYDEIKRRVIIGGVAAIPIVIILFHFFVKPLDVAWFILMRRLGLS